jgi:hypothetical protein
MKRKIYSQLINTELIKIAVSLRLATFLKTK